jgi:hypothetical protein
MDQLIVNQHERYFRLIANGCDQVFQGGTTEFRDLLVPEGV